jgi:2-deoxy-D-gluconate 3-dehydrogenase
MPGVLDKFSLKGKKAIVTGGARGLGKGIAKGFYEAGAEVLLMDALPEVHEAARETGGEKVFALEADLRGKDRVIAAFARSMELLGSVDILVTAAGVQHRQEALDFDAEQWERVLDVNLSSVFYLCQCAGRVMIEKGSGRIINVASMLSFFGGLLIPAYAASKGGVAQLTKALSNEWAGRGVCVNAVAPGYMETALTSTMRTWPDQVADITARIPVGRWGTPEDLQGVCVFLASEAGRYVSGSVIAVDGGYKSR